MIRNNFCEFILTDRHYYLAQRTLSAVDCCLHFFQGAQRMCFRDRHSARTYKMNDKSQIMITMKFDGIICADEQMSHNENDEIHTHVARTNGRTCL